MAATVSAALHGARNAPGAIVRDSVALGKNLSTDNASVLSPVPTGIMAARGVTIAGFRALKVGSANISASAGPLCSPGAACPMYAVLYSVVVIVTQ